MSVLRARRAPPPRWLRGARWLAFTNADTTVAPDWLNRRLTYPYDVARS